MTRKRDKERTRQLILDVSQELFLEKGYDNTSIQDIVDGLGGLTKGVIYHHFKSKDDIFYTIMEKLSTENNDKDFYGQWEGANGLEKLKNMMVNSLSDYKKMAIAYSARVILKSPRVIGEQYLENLKVVVPVIEKYIEEGIEDGSIKNNYPKELAETFCLLFNMWIGLHLTSYSKEEYINKFQFIKELFEGIGVPVVDEDVFEEAIKLYEFFKSKGMND